MAQELAPAGGTAEREDDLRCWKPSQIIRPCTQAQPDLAVRRLIERFGLTVPTAAAIADIAGLGIGGRHV